MGCSSRRTSRRCVHCPAYLSVPAEVKAAGFFAVVRYRLSLPVDFWEPYRVPYRIVLLGNYGSDLSLKKRIAHFVATEDPMGTSAFVKMGIERGEVRSDVDPILDYVDPGVHVRAHAGLPAHRQNSTGSCSLGLASSTAIASR